MKTYSLILFFFLSKTVFAQSFTLLPNSASSNALNTTPNRVGINIATPNSELHINRLGNVNNQIQFTNGATGTNSTNGLWFGIDEQGKAILNNRKLNSEFIININESGSFGNSLYVFEEGFRTNRPIASHNRIWVEDTTQLLNNNESYSVGAVSNHNTVELKLQTKGNISQSQFSLKRYPFQSNVVKEGISMAGQTVFENIDQYNNGAFIFLDSRIRTLNNGIESTISSSRIAINVVPNDNIGRNLDVNGDARIGTYGNTITAINNYDKDTDLPAIAGGSSFTQTNGIVIAYARVSANDTIEVTFSNITFSSIDLPQTSFNFSIITFPMTL